MFPNLLAIEIEAAACRQCDQHDHTQKAGCDLCDLVFLGLFRAGCCRFFGGFLGFFLGFQSVLFRLRRRFLFGGISVCIFFLHQRQKVCFVHQIHKVDGLLFLGIAVPAFAFEGDTAPVEQPVLPETVEDVVTITDETSGALTPEGNLTLVDDYHTNYSDGSGQQFITLVSKSGNTFYLVIDRNAKGQQTVHFMNLVDEADLLALMEEDAADAYTAEKEAAAQAEQDKLKAEEEAKKAAEEAAASGEEQPKENKVTKIASGFLGVVVLIALAAGGGFYAFTKQKQKKQAEKEALDPDANYTEDKGDFEIPVEDEPEENDEEDTEPI